MMRSTAVACSLRPKNTPAPPRLNLACFLKEVAPTGDLFLFVLRHKKAQKAQKNFHNQFVPLCFFVAEDLRANMRALLKCAPVAQRIEHLPCWSLNGEVRSEPIEWTTLYAGTP